MLTVFKEVRDCPCCKLRVRSAQWFNCCPEHNELWPDWICKWCANELHPEMFGFIGVEPVNRVIIEDEEKSMDSTVHRRHELARGLENHVVPYEEARKKAKNCTTSELANRLGSAGMLLNTVEVRAYIEEAEKRIAEAKAFTGGN